MSLTDRHFPSSGAAPKAPLPAFLVVSALFALVLALASVAAFGSAALPLIAFGVASMVAMGGLQQTYPHAALGACNVVTLLRATIVAFLVGAVFAPAIPVWLVFGAASVAFALDGVDGWLARRHGLISAFGARFDMETDAALAAVLTIWLLSHGIAGPEVLVLGFARYVFVIAGFAIPRLTADLPYSFRRKTICVVQIAALLVLVFPLTPPWITLWLPMIASGLLVWSFAVDIRWLLRRSA